MYQWLYGGYIERLHICTLWIPQFRTVEGIRGGIIKVLEKLFNYYNHIIINDGLDDLPFSNFKEWLLCTDKNELMEIIQDD